MSSIELKYGIMDRVTNMKTCSLCKEAKTFSSYYKRSDTGKYRSACKPCHSKQEKIRRDNRTPEQVESRVLATRKYSLRENYGISLDDYDSMVMEQNNKCKICLDVMKRPCVDHCHVTGDVRGLLCRPCNSGIGQLKDDPEILRIGANYIEAGLRYRGERIVPGG